MSDIEYGKTEYVNNGYADTEPFGNEHHYSATMGVEGVIKAEGGKKSFSDSNSMFRLGQFYVPENSKPVNSGGQGRIYHCNSTKSSKMYIAKIYDTKSGVIDRIRMINNQLKKINHPNIVNILDAGDTSDGANFMVVMEQYQELKKGFLLFEQHKSDLKEFNRIFVSVLRDMNQALMEIHRSNTYHSDIKPSNIMRYKGTNQDERYVLIDFGGSVAASENMNEAAANQAGKTASATATMFTKGYQAPEMFSGHMKKAKANSKTDVYALGLTMAELIAGVYPYKDEISEESASSKEKEYYRKNKDKGRTVYGILLPAELPEYYVTLFSGILFQASGYSEAKQYRWGDKEIAQWITYVETGEFKKAAQMHTGYGKSNENEPKQVKEETEKRNKMYISYNNVDVQVSSEEEMVDAFAANWNETINNVMNNPQWVRSFERMGPDVAQLLRNVGNQMKQNPEKAETIFEKRIIERFCSDEFRSYLFHNGKLYKDKKELGRTMFAVITEKLKAGEDVRLVSYKQAKSENMNDKFTQFSYIFQDGYLSEALATKGDKWSVSKEDLARIKKWEDRMNGENPSNTDGKADDVVNLLRVAFHLQEKVTFEFDGKIFTEYSKFMEYMGELVRNDKNKAMTLSRKCIEKNKMKIAFYAWCMEVSDLKNRPDSSTKPQ